MTGIEELKKKMESDLEFVKSLQNSVDKNELMKKIKDAGIDVTLDEIADALSAEGELSDDALEAVSGGFISPMAALKAMFI